MKIGGNPHPTDVAPQPFRFLKRSTVRRMTGTPYLALPVIFLRCVAGIEFDQPSERFIDQLLCAGPVIRGIWFGHSSFHRARPMQAVGGAIIL